MARFMDLRIIAEGYWRRRSRWTSCKAAGCDYAQGYYFTVPCLPRRFEQLLSQDGIVDYRGVR